MKWVERIQEKIQQINRWIAGIGAFVLIPLMVLTSSDVVGRNIFNHPVPGTIELSQYMLAIFVLLGLAYAQQVKAHVTVSIVTSRIPQRVQFILYMISILLCLFISLILIWQGWVIGMEEKTVSDMLRIPQYPFRLMVAFSALLLTLEFLIDLRDSLKRIRGKSS